MCFSTLIYCSSAPPFFLRWTHLWECSPSARASRWHSLLLSSCYNFLRKLRMGGNNNWNNNWTTLGRPRLLSGQQPTQETRHTSPFSFAASFSPLSSPPLPSPPSLSSPFLRPRPLPDFISQPWRKIGRRPGSKTMSWTGNGGLGQYVMWTRFVLTESTISGP